MSHPAEPHHCTALTWYVSMIRAGNTEPGPVASAAGRAINGMADAKQRAILLAAGMVRGSQGGAMAKRHCRPSAQYRYEHYDPAAV